MVETLIEREFKVHAINPKQMDRFRDRFTLAGAKDDSRDAEVMASRWRASKGRPVGAPGTPSAPCACNRACRWH